MTSNDPCPGVWPVWTPGTQVAEFKKRIVKHCYAQHIKSPGLMVSEKEIFVCSSHCKYMYMGANVPWDGAILNPKGITGRIYVKHHLTLLHTKYTSFGSCGFRKEDFFICFLL